MTKKSENHLVLPDKKAEPISEYQEWFDDDFNERTRDAQEACKHFF